MTKIMIMIGCVIPANSSSNQFKFKNPAKQGRVDTGVWRIYTEKSELNTSSQLQDCDQDTALEVNFMYSTMLSNILCPKPNVSQRPILRRVLSSI